MSTTAEVASITNGLDRCTNLLKDLLDQPYNNELLDQKVNTKQRKCCRGAEKQTGKVVKVSSKKTWNYGAKKQGPCKNKTTQAQRSMGKCKKPTQKTTTTFNENIPSSTPIMTPVKKERLAHQKAPLSISSSQCSVIQLLQEYNASPQTKTSEAKGDLETTLKAKDSNIKAAAQSVRQSLNQLHQVIQPYNLASGGAVEQAFGDVVRVFDLSFKTDFPPNEPDRIATLQRENLMLQTQLRSAKQELFNQKQASQTEEISFEVAALQCKNASLEEKLNEVVATLEDANKIRKEVQAVNIKLQEENDNLLREVSTKNEELTRSGKLFSSETEQIRQDVGDALQKVEILKTNLTETEEMNLTLIKEAKTKDAEIQRLTELNKGLQSSVSRLLQDLNKAPASSPSRENMSNILLRKLDDVLSVPLAKPARNLPSSPTLDAYTRSPKTRLQNEIFEDLNKISILSSPPAAVPPSNEACWSSIVSMSVPGSASSSLFSTTHAENDFNAGLATLDADIQRLQESLKTFA